MATQPDDDFDFPDRPVDLDPPPKVIVQAEDLKLGPAKVKPVGKSWAEEHGPQPPGPGLRALDFVIVGMFAGAVILILKACTWAFFN